MVYMETFGDNDFRRIYKSVDEAYKEEEEMRLNERFLQILEEMGVDKESTKHSSRTSNEYDSDEEYYHHKPQTRRRRSSPPNNKEYLKVSITDDDEKRLKEEREERARKEEKRKKIHTIDDLPPDEIDYAAMFGFSDAPPDPDVNISAGRRLGDGKVVYSASMPGLVESFGIDLGHFNLSFEVILLVLLVIFALGSYFGRRAADARSRRTVAKMQAAHAAQLKGVSAQVARLYTQNQHQAMALLHHQATLRTPTVVPSPHGWGSNPTVGTPVGNPN